MFNTDGTTKNADSDFEAEKAKDKDNKLFSLAPQGFAWASGIEDTFVPQTERAGERVLDEYALTNHYLYWREDFDRAASLGIRAMRYGIPWYKVEPSPGHFEWDWVDQVIEYAAHKNLVLIADLMHYGTPLWLDNQFLNSSYPARVANYAAHFARRYGSVVTHYTPLNEPLITMEFCGQRGIWPPYLRGDDGMVKILRAVARGITLTVEALREANPHATIVGVDAAGESLPGSPDLAEAAARRTARTFVTTDLVLGTVGANHLLFDWLLQHGLSEADLAWHSDHAIEIDIIGVNYYPETSVHTLRHFKDSLTTERVWAGAQGLERAVTAFAGRYKRPVMITETSTNGSIGQRMTWLQESLAALPRMRAAGVPVVGYTWWPLFDLIDWSYRSGLRPIEDFVARHGPSSLDTRQLAAMLEGLGWQSLEHLPLEAYLAPMGLYTLQMRFDGTFERKATELVEEFTNAISTGDEWLGEVTPLVHYNTPQL